MSAKGGLYGNQKGGGSPQPAKESYIYYSIICKQYRCLRLKIMRMSSKILIVEQNKTKGLNEIHKKKPLFIFIFLISSLF